MWGTCDGLHGEEESPGPCAAAPMHRQTELARQLYGIEMTKVLSLIMCVKKSRSNTRDSMQETFLG